MTTTQEKFQAGLHALLALCAEAGEEEESFIPILRDELLRIRQNLMPSKADDSYAAKFGQPWNPTEVELRELLQLAVWEAIPPRRETN